MIYARTRAPRTNPRCYHVGVQNSGGESYDFLRDRTLELRALSGPLARPGANGVGPNLTGMNPIKLDGY
jgi:hypothetical protein